ncbi:MAG TPA: NAD(P)-dependent oxidoreductase [Bryobacteraceae bacterium]|nr:NAD(P)-dependent oxidoreductase [Bryobacteraceae bacterium]
MRIAITGGTGFVGQRLTEQLRAFGHDVTVLARTASCAHSEYLFYSLESNLPSSQLRGFDALIHAAWDFRARDERNVAGSIRLFLAAKEARIPRIVFLSSLSAFEGCRSQYGAAKLALEKEAATAGGCAVRLGFVCDDSGQGLSGSLKKLAGLPVIPLPGRGDQSLFTVQAEDLGAAFLEILSQDRCGVVNLAHPQPISLARMMRAFARQQGKKAILLPLPWRAMWLLLRAAEGAQLSLKFRSDSLVSLMNQNPAPDFRRMLELGIHLHEFRV